MKKIALILTMLFLLVNIISPATDGFATDIADDEITVVTEENENVNEELNETNVESETIDLESSIEKNEIETNDASKENVYKKVKRNQDFRAFSIMTESTIDMEREEYRADFEAALNMDYLVPMTEENFEVVLAYENGDYCFADTAATIDEAIGKTKNYMVPNNYDVIPAVIDSNGVIVYSTNSMARFIKHKNGVVANETINVYPNSNLSGDYTYLNHNSIDDAPIIEDDGINVRVMVNGYKGWVRKNVDDKNYDVVVVPMNQVKNPSYYFVENGQLFHFISTDVTGSNGNTGNAIAVGVSPSFLQAGTKYYSYDGNYFYNNLEVLISDLKGNHNNNAINVNSKFYNYYLYLPFRSKTSYNASQINEFIDANTEANSKLRGLGQALINAQNTYGVNAAIILGVAINESAWGMSDIAQTKNNLFGMAAFDSDTGQATAFNNPGESVNHFAKEYISKGYADPQDWRYYGGFLGGKYLGANRRYASDPFWGEKAATHSFTMDKYLSRNDMSALSDYNYNQLAIYSSPTVVRDGNGNILYNISQNISSYASFVGVPIALSSLQKYQTANGEMYEIYPERQTALLNSASSEFPGEYNWNNKGYINTSAVTLINTSTNRQPEVMYSTHVQYDGWQDWRYNGQMSGTEGRSLRLEGIKIQLKNYPSASIRYSTHVQYDGWQEWKYDGQMSGTEGQSKRLEGIKIEAIGLPENLEIQYRVHVQDVGWQEWKYNGEVAGTEGQSKRLEGIEIRLIERRPMVRYTTHVQNVGWQPFVADGQMAGTEGRALRLEGIKIDARNLPQGTSIKYRTHIQDIGWQEWKYNGDISGTSGQAKRLEGIEIQLEGAPAGYHVEYRTHVQYDGWQEWKRDGQMSGTEGKALRLEGIEIRIVRD